MEQIIASYEGDVEVQGLISEAVVDKAGPQQFYMVQGLLQYQGKWVIGNQGALRLKETNLY